MRPSNLEERPELGKAKSTRATTRPVWSRTLNCGSHLGSNLGTTRGAGRARLSRRYSMRRVRERENRSSCQRVGPAIHERRPRHDIPRGWWHRCGGGCWRRPALWLDVGHPADVDERFWPHRGAALRRVRLRDARSTAPRCWSTPASRRPLLPSRRVTSNVVEVEVPDARLPIRALRTRATERPDSWPCAARHAPSPDAGPRRPHCVPERRGDVRAVADPHPVHWPASGRDGAVVVAHG